MSQPTNENEIAPSNSWWPISWWPIDRKRLSEIDRLVVAIALGAGGYILVVFSVVNLLALHTQVFWISCLALIFIFPLGILVALIFSLVGITLITVLNRMLSGYFSRFSIAIMTGGLTGYWTTAWVLLFDTKQYPIVEILLIFLAGPVLAMLIGSICAWFAADGLTLDSKNNNLRGQFGIKSLFALTLIAAIFMAIQRIVPGTTNLAVLTFIYVLLQLVILLGFRSQRLGKPKGNYSNMKLPSFDQVERLGRLLERDDCLPLLVTGIAGVAGYNAFAYFRQKYGNQVFGQRPKNNWPLSGPGIVGADLENLDELRRLLNDGKFKTVLNCGGSCALKGCELDPQMAHRVNVCGVQSLVNELKPETRFVHLSIDLVFSGTGGGNHIETDPTDPVTVYGTTMVQAEQLIRSHFPSACILRISLPMGVSFNGHAGAIDWIQSRFAKNKPATLYYDEVRTPVYVECLNEVLERVICSDASGVFHAGGRRQLSLYQIAQIVNVVGGYDPDLLYGCYRMEAGPIPPRAGNVTMNSKKISDFLGFEPFKDWPLNPDFIPDNRHWHYSRNNSDLESRIADQLYFRPDDTSRC